MMENKCVLCLSPHTDDCEIGCGGTISKLAEQGYKIYIVAFSTVFDAGDLKVEAAHSSTILGAKIILLDYKVRKFSESRQEILDEMISLNRQLEPSIVIIPSSFDTHQDHQTIFQEAFRAFKQTSIIGYEAPINNLIFKTNFFISLKERHINRKIDAVSVYKSQSDRAYTSPNFIRSLAVIRGSQINKPYAEAFETLRWIQ